MPNLFNSRMTTISLAECEPAICSRPLRLAMPEVCAADAHEIAQFSQNQSAADAPRLTLREATFQLDALREASRRKDEFLALLGHELRNPLGVMLNGIDVLDQVGLQAADAAEIRAAIRRQTANMSRLVDDLLDVTRIACGKVVLKMERLDLVQLLRDAAADHRPGIESHGGKLRLKLPPGSLWCAGDRTRLWQIFGNLLGNAAKFLDGPGEVTVEARRDLPRRQAIIEIRDTGPGIEPRALHDIFQPFVQACSREQNRGGLGIGLALVKGLVELHGGHVAAASAGPGRGSTFTVSLPTFSDQLADIGDGRMQRRSLIRRRVLLIDDRRDAILAAKTMLETFGHEVFTTSDGLDGLVVARRIVPEVILCDLGLPGELDGYGVAAAVRSDAALGDVYLVAVSGYGGEEDRLRCRDAGFDYHLTKPVSSREFEFLLTNLPRFPTP